MQISDFSFYIVQRDELSDTSLNKCRKIVETGGKVSTSSYNTDVHTLACAEYRGDLIGTAALKKIEGREWYCEQVSQADKANFTVDTSFQELGYVRVLDGHQGQGICQKLVELLLSESSGPFWATSPDPAMKHILEKCGFKQEGNSWDGKFSKNISLFVLDKVNT
ncbi:MAG: GNAT family N-acetyltransferase [bacterium]